MNFKFYDILSCLVPGFIILATLLYFFDLEYNKDYTLPYTALAFLVGYVVNAICSWLEGFYYFTWGGKPSNKLLDGHDIWKVRFYDSEKAKKCLLEDLRKTSATNNQLFHEAMKHANGKENSRVSDFNAHYAFARALLTTTIIATVLLLVKSYDNWIFYITTIPLLFIVWLRCKQRAYYYAREVLIEYLNGKRTSIKAIG